MKTSPILHAVLLPALATIAAAQTTTRWTCSGDTGLNLYASNSGDGRFIAYGSTVYQTTFPFLARHELIRLDTTTAARQLIAATDYVGSGFYQWESVLSADGRYILFMDPAAHVAADQNGTYDVYVHDSQAGYELISVDSNGTPANGSSGLPGSIASDGRYVVFYTFATSLGPNDTNGFADIALRDRVAGTTELVSFSSTGVQPDANCTQPVVSDDGRFVAFASPASNLVPGDVGGFWDVFLRDRLSGTTQRLSVNAAGDGGNADSPAQAPASRLAMSADGRFVAFQSSASNLTSNDTNGAMDVFVRDTWGNVTRRVSLGPDNVQANGSSYGPSISADGRFVGFASTASNLVTGDTNNATDVFLRDRLWSVTEIVSVTTSGEAANAGSAAPHVAAEGRFVAFLTGSTNLGDGCSYTEQSDVVQRDRGPDPLTPFCAGDGSSTACPCGNHVPAGTMAGCLHSLGTGGALAGIGNPSIGHDTLVLQGTDMPNSPALYFQGTTAIAFPFGDGLRCSGGSIVRIGMTVNVAGDSQFPNGGSPPIHFVCNVTVPGTRTYQVWFRNAATFCTPATFNLTNGLSVAWRP